MKGNNQIVEKIFKDAFQDFNPEVSPHVWNSISQQLPVSGSNGGGANAAGSAVKAGAMKLGSVGAWVAGGTAALVLSVGAIFYISKEDIQKQTSKNQGVISSVHENLTQPVDVSIINDNSSGNHDTKRVHNSQSEQSIQSFSPQKSGDKFLNEQVQNNKAGINSSSVTPSESSTESQDQLEPSITSPVSTLKENSNNPITITNELKEDPKNDEENNIDKTPLILSNSTAGFAPLQITCILNQEKLTGDWDFGDGNMQLKSNSVNHKYLQPGIYTLRCNVNNAELTKTIEVIGTISTAFSPNGDGINDYFSIESKELTSINVHLFDRNGRIVSELKSPGDRWDGRIINGENAPSGSYFYELQAVTNNGKQISQRGHINLFR